MASCDFSPHIGHRLKRRLMAGFENEVSLLREIAVNKLVIRPQVQIVVSEEISFLMVVGLSCLLRSPLALGPCLDDNPAERSGPWRSGAGLAKDPLEVRA